MASVLPDTNKYTIAHNKKYFDPVMQSWIDSLNLDEDKPMGWEISRGVAHDPEKEVSSEWACWKVGIDFTLTIKDENTEYAQTFIQTEDGWKIGGDAR